MSILLRRFSQIRPHETYGLTKLYISSTICKRTRVVISPKLVPKNKFLYYPNNNIVSCFSQHSKQTKCWHCKEDTTKLNYFKCEKCGKLQDITDEYDYFELLSLPKNFDIPASELTKTFRQLQRMVHPDKFGNKSEREQNNSSEWSALINKAYKTLSQPVPRGEYILKLQGEQIPSDNTSLNKEFLMEMMDKNEEVEDASSREELTTLNNKIQEEIDTVITKLNDLFTQQDLQGAKSKLVEIKYLLSIQSSIQDKLEKLWNK